jgi:outer membrane PBP1 activator LpoA protein
LHYLARKGTVCTMKRVYFYLFFLFFGLLSGSLLVSCSFTKTPQVARVAATPTPSYYLAQADQTTGLTQQQYLLQAANAYFQLNDYPNGQQVLTQINQTLLDDNARAEYQVLMAKSAIQRNDFTGAQTLLNTALATPNLANAVRADALQTQADVYSKQTNWVAAIQARIAATPLITDDAQNQDNQRAIWQALAQVPTDTLQTLTQNPDHTLQGWATLTLVYRQNADQPVTLLAQLRQWQQQHPNHPANPLLTADIAHLDALMRVPTQIAILLPLQGPLAEQSNAILNGIMVAYYEAQRKNLPTPTLKVYDTSNQTITAVYQQAVTEGAAFVVGPLTKVEVATLKDANAMTVPTLALNYSNNDTVIKNFYEFALSPENDARAAALRASTRANLNAITITPAGQWGKNVTDAFTQTWTEHQNTVINSLVYGPDDSINDAIAAVLNIDQSNQRTAELQKIVGHKLRSSPRRRQDIDVIFLNAFPPAAREIMPLLRFYYAGDIPVYATSVIYAGTANPARDKDLNGAQFTVTSWIISPNPATQAIQAQANQLWPRSFKQYNSLYAFGIDAYGLMAQLYQSNSFPSNGFAGVTGQLYLQDNHKIRAQLLWAQFQNGVPVLLGS